MAEERIKILHVLDSLAIGGMERVVIDVVNGLDGGRFSQVICCVSRLGEAAQQVRGEVRCYDMGKGAKRDLLMPLRLARVLRRERPDIVHTQSWSGIDGVIAGKIAGGARIVHSEHGRNLPYIHFEPLKRKLARRAIYHLADVVFTVSEETRDYYCRETGFPRERMRVIPNGVPVARFEAAQANGARGELGVAADDFVIGIVSRLNPTKDILTLARAFARLYCGQREPRLKLLIVGDGEGRAELENFAAEQGLKHAIIFAGLRQDVPRLLRAMDVFALSSLSEGMPITVLEAMCAALPVVATRVGANPELIAEGETGFLVEPRADEQMAERLARLMVDRGLARRFGAAGRRKVEQQYSLDVMLRRYEELYLSLMSRTKMKEGL
jgi:sugar transferase (PEP-CTERM/EpsH1 system associated)